MKDLLFRAANAFAECGMKLDLVWMPPWAWRQLEREIHGPCVSLVESAQLRNEITFNVVTGAMKVIECPEIESIAFIPAQRIEQ